MYPLRCPVELSYVYTLSLMLSQVRFTGYRDRPLHERQAKFQHALRDGNVELVSLVNRTGIPLDYINLFSSQSVLSTGFAFSLLWNVLENGYLEPHANTRIDFNRERGKVRFPPWVFRIVS